MTRLVRKLKPKYEGKTEADFSTKAEKKELKFYEQVKEDYLKMRSTYEEGYNKFKPLKEGLTLLYDKIKAQTGLEIVTVADVEKFSTDDKNEMAIKEKAVKILKSNEGLDMGTLLH